MTTKAEQFAALARELGPLESEAAKVKMEMLRLVHEMGVDIVTAAFPEATVGHIRTLSEIKPSDLARNAHEAVKTLNEHGRQPSIVIVDHARALIILAEPVNPDGTRKP